MKSIKLLMAMAMLAIGSTAAMAQASYTDQDGNEYQFQKHFFFDLQAANIFGNVIASQWNDCQMAQDVVLIYCHSRCVCT